MPSLVIDAAAMDDIESIFDSKSRYASAESAEALASSIFDAIKMLDTFPNLGASVPDPFLGARGYRRLSVGKHWCYYMIEDGIVHVRRVLRKGASEPLLP